MRRGRARIAQRHDALAVEHEAVLLERPLDLPNDLHLGAPLLEIAVGLARQVYASTPELLRDVARHVGGAQHLRGRRARRVEHHHADARADREETALPAETVTAHQAQQVVGDRHRLVLRAVLEQHAELVAAEPRERVAGAHLRLHHPRELLQELVAGQVAAGVVHDLELVEVDVEQGMRGPVRPRTVDGLRQALVEGAAIEQSREAVVVGLMAELALQLGALADVAQHDDRAGHPTEAVADGRGAVLDRHGVATAAEDLQLRLPEGRHRVGHERIRGPGQRQFGARLDQPHHLADVAADDLAPVDAQQLHRLGVRELDHALRVRRQHRVGNRGERDLRALLLVDQRGLCAALAVQRLPIALGDLPQLLPQLPQLDRATPRERGGLAVALEQAAHTVEEAAANPVETARGDERDEGDRDEQQQRGEQRGELERGEPGLHRGEVYRLRTPQDRRIPVTHHHGRPGRLDAF